MTSSDAPAGVVLAEEASPAIPASPSLNKFGGGEVFLAPREVTVVAFLDIVGIADMSLVAFESATPLQVDAWVRHAEETS